MEDNKIIFEVLVKNAYIKTKEDVKTRVLIGTFCSEKDKKKITAFDNVQNKKYIPSWFKDDSSTEFTLKSNYNVPVKNTDGEVVTFEDWVNAGLLECAAAKVKVIQKEGALYLFSILVTEDGKAIDYFADM